MTNVLILCTGNSARSILGEVLVTHHGRGRVAGFSAGSHPKGEVNPLALETLARHGLPTAGVRSKSWDEFAEPSSPLIDILITVCDEAARETCPVWPGHPVQVHWGIPDPATATGTHEACLAAFELAYRTLDARIRRLVALPLETVDAATLVSQLRRIADEAPWPAPAVD